MLIFVVVFQFSGCDAIRFSVPAPLLLITESKAERMNQGFILLHRKFMSWEWYQDKNTKILFIHCLLKANFEKKEWQGIVIERGQFFTSINHLSTDLKMSIKEIRTALKKLQKTNEISQKGASNGTMITVCKYDSYQEKQKAKGKRRASQGQAKGKQGATTNNDKQLNNENNVNNKDIPAYSDFMMYALSKKSNIDESTLKFKYDAWVENGWKDGFNKPIKNWKSKLLNTIPHLKEKQSAGQFQHNNLTNFSEK